jgi:glutaredoxin
VCPRNPTCTKTPRSCPFGKDAKAYLQDVWGLKKKRNLRWFPVDLLLMLPL